LHNPEKSPHHHVVDSETRVYQSSLTPTTSINGMDAEDVVGKKLIDFVHGEDKSRYWIAVYKAIDVGKSHCTVLECDY